MRTRDGSRRLVTWLLTAQGVVLCVAVLVAVGAAAVVGPHLFHEHLVQAGEDPSGTTLDHVEVAFRSAGIITLATALLSAAIAAVVVAAALSRRLTRPLDDLATAAELVAAGRDGLTVPNASGLREIAAVTAAFNQMSVQLASTEEVRAQMLSDLGHELRTPLATMTVYLDAADDGVASGPALIAVLREQVARLDRLAGDVNVISRAEEAAITLEHDTVDVHELLTSVTGHRRGRLVERAVTLTLREGTDAPVRGDHHRLQQVLTNLLDNAERHTRDGGHISITTYVRNRALVIEVTDDGDGISEEHLSHVFERFYRTDTARDRDHGGAGIGLAICRSVMRAHGGSITAHSGGPGTGATFRLTLPTP
ncbi:sensor histidine kinase [Luteipulveratus halotolerans]|uniref:sensor histidine kinase n=1 Tax=Luteipulveratus halotolerans TaxID=1631356 RepID=UPI00068202A4|nr:HAMP domain-containing sensor histidine kinase [Luteipulveratus halotolerans]